MAQRSVGLVRSGHVVVCDGTHQRRLRPACRDDLAGTHREFAEPDRLDRRRRRSPCRPAYCQWRPRRSRRSRSSLPTRSPATSRAPSETRSATGPASRPRPMRPVPRAGRSSAASTTAGCGSRRTASASRTSRNSARTTRVPINPLVSDRIEVIRGPATLRYGSQAIGGVVSSENNRVPTFIPRRRLSRAGPPPGSPRSITGASGPSASMRGGENVAVHADGFRTAADSYATPPASSATPPTRRRAAPSACPTSFDRGFVGLAYSHYDALYQIPGGEAAESRTRLDPAPGPGRCRAASIGRSRGRSRRSASGRGGSVYRHDEIGIGEDGLDGIQATFKNREAEGRIELQHVPVFTALGTLDRRAGPAGRTAHHRHRGEAGSLLAPTDSRSNARLPVRGTRRSAAACASRRPGRIEGDRSTGTATRFPATTCPSTARSPLAFGRRRRFAPKSASASAPCRTCPTASWRA